MARRVNDRGTVSPMICRGNIGASKGAFQNFKVDISMIEFTSNSKFSILLSLQVIFERVVNGLGGQKSYKIIEFIETRSIWIQCENSKIYTWHLTATNNLY